VKLADRLHNMRTLHFVPKPEKRARIARETLDIYGPLARRVGLAVIASEMEDLAFAEIHPDARTAILLRLEEMEKRGEGDLKRIETRLKALVTEAGTEAEVLGRRKAPYSIWRKLEQKDLSFSQIGDLFAFRIITGTLDDCYRLLGRIHTTWKALPDKFRDYISVPKPNGYRSIHTTLMASERLRVEVQLRTRTMHDEAERGVAAHWRYKNAAYGFDADGAREAGLNSEFALDSFATLMEEQGDVMAFLEDAKLEMYREKVFTFTPKGRLVVLDAGAKPLDFAYAIHSNIGNTAIGVRINGEVKPLRTELRNGDTVEIIRGPHAAPIAGFEMLASTHRARVAQKRLIAAREHESYRLLGRGLLERSLRAAGIDPLEVDMARVCEATGRRNADALHEDIGRSRLEMSEVMAAAFPGFQYEPALRADVITMDDNTAPLMVSGKDIAAGTAIHLERCCSPVPGDRIIGIRVAEKGLSVHAIDCANLAEFDDSPDRWVDLSWTRLADEGVVAIGRIRVVAVNKRGVLATLCSAVAQANGNIAAVSTQGERGQDYIELSFDIEIEDVKRLNQILAALRTLAVVDRAERLREHTA
jgi:RelA/SpoT family (p)ppGpp synthetase